MSVGSNGLNGIGMDQRTNKSAQTQVQISDPPPLTNHKRGMQVGATEGRDVPERGQPASLRPVGLARARVKAMQPTPTPGGDQERPGEDGGLMATSLGRLA